jgi:preprotein translocase subunit SecE
MARKRQRAKDRKQKLHRENVPGSLDHASGEVEGVEAAIVAGAGGVPVEPAPDGVADEPVDAVQPDDAVEPEPAPDDVVEPDDLVEPEPADLVEPEPDLVEPEPEVVEADVAEPEPVGATEPAAKSTSRRRRRRKPAAEPVAPLEPVAPEAVDDYALDEDEDEAAFGDGADADAAEVEHDRLGHGAGDLAVTPDAHKPAGFRIANFIRACWAELQRVDWPDRRQVGQATAVVLGFVVVAGAFLGLADVVAQRIVDFIL